MTRLLFLFITLLPALSFAQSGAALTGSATHLLFADDNYPSCEVSVSGEQSKSSAGTQQYNTRHFLIGYHARIGHHQNQFGATASAHLDLDASEDTALSTRTAIDKLDSLGKTDHVRGHVKSVEVRSVYGVLIDDAKQSYIGIEFSYSQAYADGLERMSPDTLPRQYNFNSRACYSSLQPGIPVDSIRHCFVDPGVNDKDTMLRYCAAGDQVTCITQSLDFVSHRQASYHYTCYRTSGTRAHVDSLAAVIAAQGLSGNGHFADSLRMDLLIVKDSTIRKGEMVGAQGQAVVYDILSGRRYNVSFKRGRSVKLIVRAQDTFTSARIIETLYLNPYQVLPNHPQQFTDTRRTYRLRFTDSEMKIISKGPGLFLPPVVLRFLYGGLRSY